MKHLSSVYRAGSWAYILVGTGHVITTIFFIPDTPERAQIVRAMQESTISMLGTESNLFAFHQGFSNMMGTMLFAYGLLYLSLVNEIEYPSFATRLINVGISLVR
jgi:hypothetical protein